MSRRMLQEIEILFDGPPGPTPGRFIEVQDPQTGESVGWGEWLDNGDGTWSLIGQGEFSVNVGEAEQ